MHCAELFDFAHKRVKAKKIASFVKTNKDTILYSSELKGEEKEKKKVENTTEGKSTFWTDFELMCVKETSQVMLKAYR